MSNESVYAVVLAGGSGQRFWPLSRELSPKQMLTVFGQESLIAQAIHRVDGVVESSRVFVVTNERLFDELRNHLSAQPDPRLHALNYLIEPQARNTAPAIAYAAAVLERNDPEAVMIVLPADHVLEADQAWQDCLECAVPLARAGDLVTIGVTPTRVETGYGYIQAGSALPEFAVGDAVPRRVSRFVEKPDYALAEEFVSSGEYFWNAGVFVMRAVDVLSEMDSREDTREIASVARWLAEEGADGAREADVARERFGALPSISIDYAVMERSSRVLTIPAALDWSDVGSLLALQDVRAQDAAGNVRVGRGVDIDTTDSIVYTTDRLVATLGVHDLMVVDTADATLVLPKDRAQDVRQVFDALKLLGADEVVQPKVSLRPWGSWTSLLRGPGFHIKRIDILPGTKLSLQRHERRSEHWVVVEGAVWAVRGAGETELRVNESTYISAGEVHRLENRGDQCAVVIEIQVGEYVGEDDIVRLEDDWNR